MECEAFKQMINRRMDGELEEKHAPHLDRHLSSCPDCSAYEKDLQKMRAFFNASDAPSPSGELGERVLAAARAEQRSVVGSRRHWAKMQRAAAAACLLATLSLTLVFFASRDPVQAVDRNKEIHYEDFFQRVSPGDRAELLRALIITNNPRHALKSYNVARRP